tara:strand:- start:240 stop:1058 length:819 start_codon:yes stop_codon:yes gene_type:complete
MPELPEVETVRVFLDSHMTGQKANKINIINNKLRYKIPNNLNQRLSNTILTKINRRGKYLILEYENNLFLLLHLGMTGYFRFSKIYNFKKHDHLYFKFDDFYIIFNDIRKFGYFKLYEHKEFFNCKHLKNMGPEPLKKEFDFNYFLKSSKRDTNIKNLLMNQNFVAGLGNIYCSEILFKASVSPQRNSKSLKKDEILNIINSTKKILKKSIKLGGTSIKNFIVSDLKIGYFKNQLNVYGRDNMICKRCKNLYHIKKIVQNGRSTFFCSNCQF